MGLFRNLNKPGPGVPKNAPRKKGVPRFFEILGRDFGNLVKLNLLTQLGFLPSQGMLALSIWAYTGGWGVLFVVSAFLGALSGIVLGAACAAQQFCLAKMLRNEPGFIGQDFKRAFTQTLGRMAGPGMLYAILLGVGIYTYLFVFSAQAGVSIFAVGLFVVLALLVAMAAPWLFLQGALLPLGAGAMLKHSVVLAVAYFLRSLAGALLGGALTLIQWRVFPLLTPVTLVVGYSIPALIQLMWIWPPFEKTFQPGSAAAVAKPAAARPDEDEPG
ncbi:MAG: hypothetical protein GXY32_04145 [Ruminococcaceae bacterium]|nr:hypothetical protein [Oscillospiraceae bacterium]